MSSSANPPIRTAHVTGWGRYVPAQVLSNKDLERMVDTNDEWIVTRTGIRERRVAASSPAATAVAMPASGGTGPSDREPVAPAKPSIKAPLTGIFYGAPSPGATAYVSVGDHVSVGQVIGLIEAMKLFNEIKSDLAGRVVKIHAEGGKLVRAKQPLMEVEPL